MKQVPKFIVRWVVLPDVDELDVKTPTFQVMLTDLVGKLLQEKADGNVAVIVVTALKLFLLRMALLGLLTTREIELLTN
jgi:hypothetical protein